ncbi:hypothetical protein niasHT_002345 [Heterodera trifolii]|uniref:Uncharacterized protein n=1 Tax=Heterodera trifolii TaxID=157864 RepID=A0ABD2LMZ2_9BILA
MSVIKKIDKDSVESLEGSLSLFSLPPTNVAINKTNVRELLPLSALNQTGPYLFCLFSDSQYCDLSKTYMYLLSSIERKNDAGEWVALSDTDPNDKHVGVIQNFGSSFVRSLKVNISGIEELGYSQEIRKAFHEASCYYPDDDDQNSATNPGFTARAARFSGGKQCETMVKLNFDLARQNALMLNNQDVIFTIHRNNDSFLLLTPTYKKPDGTLQENKKVYRIRVHDMRLYVRTVDVTPSLNLAISRQLESTSAKYPLRKIEMRSIFLGTGRTELAHNVFTSTLPRRLICTFVSTDAYSGNRKMSPYKFEHANLRSISVEANGQTFPSTPYLLSFDGTQPRFVRAFVDMYAGLGLDDSDTKTVSIGMQRFLNGWAFFVIPLTSTLEDTPGFELIRQGTCTIKVQFEQPIKADGFEMLVLGEFDSVLSINADRVLSTDGTCRIEKCERDNEWAVSLQNVYTLHSYQNRESGETAIFRGHQQKIVQRLSKHGRVVFDHLSGRLFLIDKHQRRISEIELEYLEHWWLRKNQSSAHTILKSNFVAFLPPDKSDFTLVDNHVFVIRDQRIYEFHISDYAKGNRALTFVTNSNDFRFNYLIYKPKDENINRGVFAHLRMSDAWMPISYLFNLFLIILCTYILKQLRRVNRKNPLNGSGSTGYYSNPFIDDAYSSQHQQLLNIPAIRYLIDSYGLSSVDDLYTCLKDEIKSRPEGGNCLYPNPLCAVDCVNISNADHPNQPVHIDGSLELIADVELYSTCYPKKKYEGIVWSEPLYVELKDLKICPGDSPLCLSRHCEQPNSSSMNLIVDELDLINYWSDDERENEITTW